MKGILLSCVGFLFITQMFSQEAQFGLTAGYLNLSVSSFSQGSEVSENSSGFFAGIFGDFALSESLHIEPAAIYGNAGDSNILFIPVVLKYYFGESGINLLAGPQGTMILDEINPDIKRLGWDITLGAGYDVTENIFIRARYALEISNRYNEEIIGSTDGVKSSINSLFAGVGYKF